MRIDLGGKIALVTGGAQGIGRAAVKCLLDCGAEVWAMDRNGEELGELARELNVRTVVADVADPASVEAAFAEVGDFDILIANAGIGVTQPLTETTKDLWDRTIAINLTGVFLSVQLAARSMKRRRSGAIVLTASTNSYDGEADLVAYNASKAGVLGILHTAANELGAYGIRVNAVCPGLIRTKLTHSSFHNPDVVKPYFEAIALGRGGEPEEVAQAIVFLASDLASYITGAALLVDGGQMASKFSVWNDTRAIFETDHWRLRD